MVEIPEAVRGYMDIVKAEEYPVCKEQKLLIEMIERVLTEEEIYFDLPQLEKYLSYQKYFPFKLFPWERFVFALHNTLYKAPGLLRFPIAFLCVGRGTGKTGYSSYENFCLLTPTNGVKQYDIYTFATSERQAKMAWEDMYDLLDTEPAKFKRFFKWTKEVITNIQTNSSWYYCTSSPGTKDGQRPGKVDFDEYHAYTDYKLIDVAVTGLGKKKLPRRTITTTNGIVRGGPFDDLFNKCIDILNGDIPDNGVLPFICRIDSEQEVHDKAAWHKANPSMRYLPDLLAEMELEYTDYVVNPVANVSFIAKRMNLPPVQMENEVTSWENLMVASRHYDVDILRRMCCVGGIDYASTTDVVGAGLLFRNNDIDYWVPHAWVCEKSADLPRIKAPLREWARMGLLTFVNAPEIPPDLPAAWLAMKAAELEATVLKIGIDKYRYTLLAKALKAYGFSTEKGCENINLLRPSDEMANIPAISAKFAGGRICWGDNPLMRWFANNSKIDMSGSGNMTYQKIEPKSRKTDGFKAFAAAECVSEVLDVHASGGSFLQYFYGD